MQHTLAKYLVELSQVGYKIKYALAENSCIMNIFRESAD